VDKTVVLIHGYAEDGTIWDRQADHLKERYRLIVPDLPGSGRSALPRGEPSIDELAAYIKTLLDKEKISQCVMIGHSLGGYVALAFAEKYPDRLKAFGLFHSTAYADSEEKKAARRKGIEFIRKNGAAPFIRQSIPNLFAESSRKEHPELVTELTDRYAHFNPDSLIYYYEAMIKRPDRTAVLQHFPGPILFIIGQQDNAIPLEHSLQQAHMPALAHIHILTQAGHIGMLEDSDNSNRILDDFLNFTYE
jgi:pimeloyl-ACP methyl ester carboxylesterase